MSYPKWARPAVIPGRRITVDHRFCPPDALTRAVLTLKVLGILSLGAWWRVTMLPDGSGPLDSELGFYLAVGVLGCVFSPCSAIIAAVKAAEARLQRTNARTR